jgi:RNA polymerase sigma factor for flagellar operon FliA
MDRSDLLAMTDDEFIEHFRNFVGGIATNLVKGLKLKIPREDVEQYGFMGLLQARERYHDDSKAAFTSFAYYRVRGAMLDGCRKAGWMSRDRSVSIEAVSSTNGYLESSAETFAGAPPARSLDEAVTRIGDKVGDVLTIMFLQDEEDLDAVVTPNTGDQLEAIELSQRSRDIAAALAQLDDREALVLRRHHFQNESLTDIGRDLGLNKSWVCRLHARGIEKMRKLLLDTDYNPEHGR